MLMAGVVGTLDTPHTASAGPHAMAAHQRAAYGPPRAYFNNTPYPYGPHYFYGYAARYNYGWGPRIGNPRAGNNSGR
jgi:hypothetical protein